MVILLVLAVIIFLLMHLQAKKLVITNVDVETGIRLVHISDLHFDMITVEPVVLVKEICKLEPEIILITGDLCTELKYFGRILAFLDMLAYKAECPILITLGNHDERIFKAGQCSKEKYISELERLSAHIHVLENQKFVYKGVLFGGLGDIKSNESDYAALAIEWNKIATENNFRYILATHNPDIVINLPKLERLTVLLAGHTHGGQVHMPLNIEFAVLKKDILPKRRIFYGVEEYNGNKMYITSGIGCSVFPIRFKSKAEIAFFN